MLAHFLLLAFLHIVQTGPAETGSAEDGASRPCPTCEGRGTLEQTCAACEGVQSRPCKVCARADFLQTELQWAAPSRRTALEGELALEREKLARDGASDGSPRKRGYRDCSSKTCLRGTIAGPEEGQAQTCGYCEGKGQVQCWRCKSTGHVGCPYCLGQGRNVSTCLDCAGSGRLPVPDGKDPSTCPWCSGAGTRPCSVTSEKLTCTWCLGRFKAACRWCVGLRKEVCERCDGARVSKSSAGALERCEVCNGRGFQRCSHCERGVVACEACIGIGVSEQPCRACQGSGQVACTGCAGGAYRAWELSGDVLAELGDTEKAELEERRRHAAAARSYYGVAIERCRRLFAKRRQDSGESLDAGLDEQLAAELQRLEARAAAVRE